MIDREILVRYAAETEADLRSIGAGAGLTLEVQRERLERLAEVLNEIEQNNELVEAGDELGGAVQKMIMQNIKTRGHNQMTKTESAAFEAVASWQRLTGRMPPLPEKDS